MGKTILIVEDEPNIVDILSFDLMKEGYETIEAYDGTTGLQLAKEQNPDLILLDVMLPGINGFEICKAIRASGSAVPILMLTAREEETDKVLGLELGADDYITKPFSVRELIARVKANLRKVENLAVARMDNDNSKKKENKIIVNDLELDLDKFEVKIRGEIIDLTVREFEVIKFLASQPGQVVTRETLLEKVWGYEYYGDIRTVDVTVRRIREKIEKDTSSPKILITKRGVGYYIASK